MPPRPALRTEAICSEAIGEVALRPLALMLLRPRLGLILRLKPLHLWYSPFFPTSLVKSKTNECSRSSHWGMAASLITPHSSLTTDDVSLITRECLRATRSKAGGAWSAEG